ncbi:MULTISPECIES: hypothetical protein [Clostridium]|uniref:WxL domain-containing protein n=1 Tax=Clostridium cibarium TaxID=2762247 RepID=A0ABR8PSX2_9CLOT|nr:MULTISPECIES: hypothetical protein [Clostridium]MBD7911264.1 hypothetical protein [Clostridium cibarium]
MKVRKIISLVCLVTLSVTLTLAFPQSVFAEQKTANGTATQTGNPDAYVEVNVPTAESQISYGTLNISAQAVANGRIDPTTQVKYVIFESEKDLGAAQHIGFNEGATNSNAYYSVASSGETYPTGSGLSSNEWIYLRDTGATAYVPARITGTLTNGGGGVTMPGGGTITEVGSFAVTQNYYTSADAGVTWNRNSQTIYVALGSNNRLYVGNSATLSDTQYFTTKGEARSDSFNNGNSMVLTTTPAAGAAVNLDFGYNIPWDATQSNANKALYTLVDMPQHAATGHDWHWDLNITGEYLSNP